MRRFFKIVLILSVIAACIGLAGCGWINSSSSPNKHDDGEYTFYTVLMVVGAVGIAGFLTAMIILFVYNWGYPVDYKATTKKAIAHLIFTLTLVPLSLLFLKIESKANMTLTFAKNFLSYSEGTESEISAKLYKILGGIFNLTQAYPMIRFDDSDLHAILVGAAILFVYMILTAIFCTDIKLQREADREEAARVEKANAEKTKVYEVTTTINFDTGTIRESSRDVTKYETFVPTWLFVIAIVALAVWLVPMVYFLINVIMSVVLLVRTVKRKFC